MRLIGKYFLWALLPPIIGASVFIGLIYLIDFFQNAFQPLNPYIAISDDFFYFLIGSPFIYIQLFIALPIKIWIESANKGKGEFRAIAFLSVFFGLISAYVLRGPNGIWKSQLIPLLISFISQLLYWSFNFWLMRKIDKYLMKKPTECIKTLT